MGSSSRGKQRILSASSADVDSLKTLIGTGTVLTVADENPEAYDAARSRPWNFDGRGFPAIIVRVKNSDEVAAAVRFAIDSGIEIAVASGCHSAKAMVDKTLVIDFFEMKNVDIDESAKKVTVQPGCTLGDVDKLLKPHGLVVPWGTNPYTGVAGLTLSGGGGFLGRKYGLTVDNLLAVDAVLMDGRKIHATAENEHADFLWACCGGGGSFGIIVAFHFQAHTLPSNYNVARYETVYLAPTLSSQRTILKNYAAFMKDADGCISNAMALPCGAPVVPDTWVKFGEGLTKRGSMPEELKPCGALGGWFKVQNSFNVVPYFDDSSSKPWKNSLCIRWFRTKKMATTTVLLLSASSMIPRSTSLQKYTRTVTPNGLSAIVVFPLGGAIAKNAKNNDVLEDQRKAAAWIIIEGKWSEKSGKDGRNKVRDWVRALKGELEKLPGTFETSHSLTSAIESDKLGETQLIFSTHKDKLYDVKTKYDPKNLLRHNRNIAVKN